MKKVISLILALLIAATMLIASAETVKTATAGGTLYLRNGAGTKYTANGTVKNGDSITVLSKGSVWSKIRTSDGREGYIKNLYISGMGKNYADGTTYYSSAKSGTISTKYATSTVNLRAGASKSEAKIAGLKSGTKVKVLGKNGSWYLVSTATGTQGYVSASYVKVSGSSTTTTATVNTKSVNMRDKAGVSGNKLFVLTKGTKVTVLSKLSSGWWKVQYKGKTGYIYGSYLK